MVKCFDGPLRFSLVSTISTDLDTSSSFFQCCWESWNFKYDLPIRPFDDFPLQIDNLLLGKLLYELKSIRESLLSSFFYILKVISPYRDLSTNFLLFRIDERNFWFGCRTNLA